MSTRPLPTSVSPALLRTLTPREFCLVVASFGLLPVVERLKVGAEQDDLPAYQLIVDRIAQAEAARSTAK